MKFLGVWLRIFPYRDVLCLFLFGAPDVFDTRSLVCISLSLFFLTSTSSFLKNFLILF